ncbi:hypothetical protein F5Y18DRAFT_421527 [Xylariaceae sp. FL1019]|nr:hypothetical protein F5Y18DRAFT_421527 [Xylariaceae sp. FL1019]
MSDITSLPPAIRFDLESLGHRIESWLQTPGEARLDFWKMDSDRPYSFTASQLVHFTQHNCLVAVSPPENALLQEFQQKLQTDWQNSQTRQFTAYDLCKLTSEYAVWVDKLFFFGLFTRPVRQEDGGLHSSREVFTWRCAQGDLPAPDGQDMYGNWDVMTGTVYINLRKTADSELAEFDMLLGIVAHELSHMYLDVLTRDDSPSRYWHEVMQERGHGAVFQILCNYILSHFNKLVPGMRHIEEDREETFRRYALVEAQPRISDAAATQLLENLEMVYIQ